MSHYTTNVMITPVPVELKVKASTVVVSGFSRTVVGRSA
jgi:hypothetical protein